MSLVYKYSFIAAAEEEYINAIRWYKDISKKLAETFIEDFNQTIAQICKHPEIPTVISKRFRKLNFEIFPYKIVYRIEDGSVVIVAVAHHKRHPRYWKKRK
ncbi:MAG: type II toxin-antitoxin system RelE/ParE family toxin [Chitinophagales bacterium]|nr:type II toxin-antitoxin system RelE/ParE family toxin [Chitinophagales bacterium]